jgi:predicted oxidoreductase
VKLGALPIIGTLNEQRIHHIASAFEITLDRQDWYELYNIAKDEY